MKLTTYFIAVSLFLFIPVAALHAQTSVLDHGSINIAGDAAFTSSGSGDGDRTTQLIIRPSAQYFIIPGFAVGGNVIVTHFSRDHNSSTTIGAGPSAAYYFGRGERNVYPFISGSFTVLRTSFENDFTNQSASATGYRGSGGVLFMLSQSVGITGELFYQGQNSDDFNTNTYGLAFGVSAFVF